MINKRQHVNPDAWHRCEKYKGIIATLNVLNNKAYNKQVLPQEDIFYFQIVEEARTKTHQYGDAR